MEVGDWIALGTGTLVFLGLMGSILRSLRHVEIGLVTQTTSLTANQAQIKNLVNEIVVSLREIREGQVGMRMELTELQSRVTRLETMINGHWKQNQE